jgi:hypothetical protein
MNAAVVVWVPVICLLLGFSFGFLVNAILHKYDKDDKDDKNKD